MACFKFSLLEVLRNGIFGFLFIFGSNRGGRGGASKCETFVTLRNAPAHSEESSISMSSI